MIYTGDILRMDVLVLNGGTTAAVDYDESSTRSPGCVEVIDELYSVISVDIIVYNLGNINITEEIVSKEEEPEYYV